MLVLLLATTCLYSFDIMHYATNILNLLKHIPFLGPIESVVFTFINYFHYFLWTYGHFNWDHPHTLYIIFHSYFKYTILILYGQSSVKLPVILSFCHPVIESSCVVMSSFHKVIRSSFLCFCEAQARVRQGSARDSP